MKKMIKNRKLSWTIRIVLIVLALIITHGACYLQGMFRANRKAVIRIANDNCFFPLLALQAGGDDELEEKFRPLFERELDVSSVKLAEMCLAYPNLAERKHYNLLVKIKKYKGTVDPKVDEAIFFLESTHDTNEWGQFWVDPQGKAHKGNILTDNK